MEPQQPTDNVPEPNTIQTWWEEADFNGKEYCRLTEDGVLMIKATPFSPEHPIGHLNLENAAAAIRALIEKFPEVAAKVKELEEEWDGAEDKLKLTGKVARVRDYLLHSSAIGDFETLHKQVSGWDQVIHDLAQQNYQVKLALAEKAEAIAEGNSWKEGTIALRKLAEEWKLTGYVEKTRNDELWNRIEAARTKFFDRKREHQESQEKDMLQNLDLKMELVEKAENIAASESWKESTEVFKKLMDQWKTIGRTMNDKNEALWTRFITAKNVFYDRKKQHFEVIQKEQEGNYIKKMALVEQAEALADNTDWQTTSQAFNRLMDEWKSIGRVPSDKSDELWDRLNKAKEIFFNNKRQHTETFRVNLEDNYAQKIALTKRAEELKHATNWREASEEFKELMEEWRKTGPVPREHSETIWEQFIAARHFFFDRKDADRERRKSQMERHQTVRATQTQQFLQSLRDELKEEEGRLADFREAIGNLTTGPKEEELRQHLEKLIAQTEPKVKRKLEKIADVEKQMIDIEKANRKAKRDESRKEGVRAESKQDESPVAESTTAPSAEVESVKVESHKDALPVAESFREESQPAASVEEESVKGESSSEDLPTTASSEDKALNAESSKEKVPVIASTEEELPKDESTIVASTEQETLKAESSKEELPVVASTEEESPEVESPNIEQVHTESPKEESKVESMKEESGSV